MTRSSQRITAVLCALTALPLARPGTVELTSSRDNTLYEDSAGGVSNGAGEHFFAGRTAGGGIRRGLVRFNIDAANLPPTAVIVEVSVRMHVSRTVVGPATFALHRLTSDWGEGGSNAGSRGGAGTAAQSGDATWLHQRFPGVLWATAGGDFAAHASAATVVDGVGAYVWTSTPELVADVEAWRAHPLSNFGWCVIGDESDASAKRFDTRENIDSAVRPRLTITFHVPPACPGDQNGDGTVDAADLPAFVECLGGPAQPASPECTCSDYDGDLDVDLADFAAFQRTVGG